MEDSWGGQELLGRTGWRFRDGGRSERVQVCMWKRGEGSATRRWEAMSMGHWRRRSTKGETEVSLLKR